jgi:hypothetical protein
MTINNYYYDELGIEHGHATYEGAYCKDDINTVCLKCSNEEEIKES